MFVSLYVCMSAKNSRTGRAIDSKCSEYLDGGRGWFKAQKVWAGDEKIYSFSHSTGQQGVGNWAYWEARAYNLGQH